MSSLYGDLGSDPEIRLSRSVALIQNTINDATNSINSIEDFVTNDAFGDFNADAQQNGFLRELGDSPNNEKITKDLYEKIIKPDLQVLVNKYVAAKYPPSTTVDLLLEDKKKIIIDFFSGGQDDLIIASLIVKSSSERFVKHKSLLTLDEKIKSFSRLVTVLPVDVLEIEKVLDQLGFAEWLKEQDDFSILPDEISGLNALGGITAADTAKLNTIKNAVRNIKGMPPAAALTPEEQRNINQCALITDLLHLGDSYASYPTLWNKRKNPADTNKCFNGRIYPVTPNSFNSDSLVNMCTIPKTIKSFFNKKTEVNGVTWGLYWVFVDSTGIKEEKIFKTNKDPKAGSYIDKLSALKTAGFLTADLKSTDVDGNITYITKNISKQRKGYTITGIDITYEGTNPSTARNDVKATLKIKLDSLLALKSTCCYVPLKTTVGSKDRRERVEIKIADLVGGPQSNTYETDVIAQGNIKREFVPDFSRIRLKVRTGETDLAGTDMIIDLATIDHQISTPSSTGETEMTITYRGYFEQAMNMPYNDALAGETLITNRQARSKKIKDAKAQKCSNKLIREIARINQEQERLEVEAFHADGGLIRRIYDSGDVYSYELDDAKLSQGQNGNILDPRLNYVIATYPATNNPMGSQTIKSYLREWGAWEWVQKLVPSAATGPTSDVFVAKLTVKQMVDQNVFNESTPGPRAGTGGYVPQAQPGYNKSGRNFNKGHFFWLGDLMYTLLDCLYEADTADHRTYAKGMNMRFIVGTIRVPDPNDLTNFLTINPLQIPIDMAFFASWYHDTIIKKGITQYPIGTFMRDLIERLINDVIYDTCFSTLLPDEQPPQLRTTFFTDCDSKNRWFGTFNSADTTQPPPGEWFNPNVPYADGAAQSPNILMKKNSKEKIENCKNYCVIYQQSPSYFRQLKAQEQFNLSDDPYCPTMYYGYNMMELNYLQSVTLTKSNSTYLKEARFFSSQLGNLSLLSNIYDLSFDIKNKKINTMFYPGNIINLIITDFEGGSDKKFQSFASLTATTTDMNGVVTVALNESNPHKKNTLANTLGIGGYHIIKSVTYKIDNKLSNNMTISVSTKFSGTDAKDDDDRDSSSVPKVQEQEACITQYNDALGALRATEPAPGIRAADFDINTEAGRVDETPNRSTSEQAERVLESPVMVPVVTAAGQDDADAEVTAALAKQAAAAAAAAASAGSDVDILQAKYNYNDAAQYTKNTEIKGARVNKAKYKDMFLVVKDIDKDKANKTVKILWNVIDTDGNVLETFTATHKNKEP